MVSTKKIFVGGLGHNTSEDDVKTFFSKFGTVGQGYKLLACLEHFYIR